jgi:putrescine importer
MTGHFWQKGGSVYTFAQKVFNPHIGFLAGWLVLLSYCFLPMIDYLASAIFLEAAFPEIPLWVWITVFSIIVTVVNILGIKVADITNRVVTILQLVFLATLAFFIIRLVLNGGGAGTLFDWNAFFSRVEYNSIGQGFSVFLVAASILALAFLGFDGISTLCEESIRPKRDVPKAIMLSCLIEGALYVVFTYIMQLAWPNAWQEITDIDSAAFEVISKLAGSLMGYLFVAGYVVGCIAAAVAAVASASRILYNMGRDGLLPKFFGKVNSRFQTPTNSIIIIGLFGFTGLVFSLEIASCFLNYGALLGFTIVNLCVIKEFWFRQKQRGVKGFISNILIPLGGAVFTFALWINLNLISMILGTAWMVIGIIYLGATTKGFKKLPAELDLEE